MTLLRPFLDATPYQSASIDRAGLAEKYGLPINTPWLLAVGMMRPGDKLASYRELAVALSTIADKSWQLLVAGDGTASSEVHAAFESLASRVSWLGTVSENQLASIYQAADLMVWPAVREAFGMALLEAQAAGLPVVAGCTDGVPAVVSDGETGLLPPPGDTVAFAAAVSTLLALTKDREAMGLAARQRVLRHQLVGKCRSATQ